MADSGMEGGARKHQHDDEESASAKRQALDHSHAVATHYNELKEAGLSARSRSRIFYMRNFNNWLKSVLIGDVLDQVRDSGDREVSVLDLGCGKGGDLLKWRRGHIHHLVCADIAAVSVDQCRSRYEDMQRRGRRDDVFSAQFIAADCTKEVLAAKLDPPDQTFDICSCQFVVHYAFESQQKAELMLRNACERLKPGGFFVGTTPDAYELVKRLEASDALEFGNDVFQVKFEGRGSYPLFGCRYHFHLEEVVDVPEFLVYFPLLEHMAQRYGMRLISKQRFSDFFQEKIQTERHRDLMMRMGALERFPCEEAGPQDSAEYSHAHARHSGGDTRDAKPVLGTLSRSEWEATSIYLVFVFQKAG